MLLSPNDDKLDNVLNISDTSIQNVFEIGEHTVNENHEDLTNNTVTNEIQEIVENRALKENEESSAIKDSQSINNSNENIYSVFCIYMCYLALIYYK